MRNIIYYMCTSTLRADARLFMKSWCTAFRLYMRNKSITTRIHVIYIEMRDDFWRVLTQMRVDATPLHEYMPTWDLKASVQAYMPAGGSSNLKFECTYTLETRLDTADYAYTHAHSCTRKSAVLRTTFLWVQLHLYMYSHLRRTENIYGTCLSTHTCTDTARKFYQTQQQQQRQRLDLMRCRESIVHDCLHCVWVADTKREVWSDFAFRITQVYRCKINLFECKLQSTR